MGPRSLLKFGDKLLYTTKLETGGPSQWVEARYGAIDPDSASNYIVMVPPSALPAEAETFDRPIGGGATIKFGVGRVKAGTVMLGELPDGTGHRLIGTPVLSAQDMADMLGRTFLTASEELDPARLPVAPEPARPAATASAPLAKARRSKPSAQGALMATPERPTGGAALRQALTGGLRGAPTGSAASWSIFSQKEDSDDEDDSDSDSAVTSLRAPAMPGLRPAIPTSGSPAAPDMAAMIQLETLKLLDKLSRRDAEGSDSGGDRPSGRKGQGTALHGMHRRRQRYKRHPLKPVRAFVLRTKEQLGVRDDRQVWLLKDLSVALRALFGKMTGLWRCHHLVMEALQFAVDGEPEMTALLLTQMAKALHQVALDGGDWVNAVMILQAVVPDPLRRQQFGGDEGEMEDIQRYRRAVSDLKKSMHGKKTADDDA